MGTGGHRRAALVATVAAVALLLAGCAGVLGSEAGPDRTATTPDAPAPPDGSSTGDPPAEGPAEGGLPEGREVVVTSITDGDTFRAGDERVRLIGIDTPEVSGGVECYGREATDALARLAPVGSTVRLVADVEPHDRYGRTLAYVYRPDGAHVNLAMARDGYAVPLTVPPNVAHSDAFVAAAAEAREAARGLWSACGDEATPAPTTTGTPDPTTTGPGAGPGAGVGCDPAYPDVCIPPSPPDLDCGDIPHRRFRVLPPDPHRFDGGGDGIGCESG